MSGYIPRGLARRGDVGETPPSLGHGALHPMVGGNRPDWETALLRRTGHISVAGCIVEHDLMSGVLEPAALADALDRADRP